MKLYKVRAAATWVDPFGDKHSNLMKYVRVLEVITVIKIVQDPDKQIMLDNGYEPPYPIDVYAAHDGRQWAEMTDHISYHPVTWYRPLFKERIFQEGVYDQSEEGNIGPPIKYLHEKEMGYQRCVNQDGKAVDIEENLL